MTTYKDDIKELKDKFDRFEGKLDRVDGKLDSFLVAHAREQALMESKLNHVAGKVNTIIAFTLAVVSGLAYAAWDYIKHKLGLT